MNEYSSRENKLEVSFFGDHPRIEEFKQRLQKAGYKVTSYNGSPYYDADFVVTYGDNFYTDGGAERWLARTVPRE